MTTEDRIGLLLDAVPDQPVAIDAILTGQALAAPHFIYQPRWLRIPRPACWLPHSGTRGAAVLTSLSPPARSGCPLLPFVFRKPLARMPTRQ